MKPPIVVEVMDGIHQCLDCGARAASPEKIEHYKTCDPGCSERWRQHYAQEKS